MDAGPVDHVAADLPNFFLLAGGRLRGQNRSGKAIRFWVCGWTYFLAVFGRFWRWLTGRTPSFY